MTTQESSTTPTKVDVDPNGDVVLDVGKGKDRLLIRASSRVLSLTSEPFATLVLDPNIKENQHASSKERSKVIPMQDDDPQIMFTLCKITHYKHSTVKPPTGKELIAITLLCDKYDCTDAISMWVIAHLSRHFPFDNYYIVSRDLKDLQLSLPEVVALAYIYDDHRVLMYASRSLALQTTSAFTESMGIDLREGLANLLPRSFFNALESKRRQYINDVCNELCITIAGSSANHSRCNCGNSELDPNYHTSEVAREHKKFNGCMTSMLQASFYLNLLWNDDVLDYGYWDDTAPPKTSAHVMLNKTKAIAKDRWAYKESARCRGVPTAPGMKKRTKLTDVLSTLMDDMPKRLKGLCLNAVKVKGCGLGAECNCLCLDSDTSESDTSE